MIDTSCYSGIGQLFNFEKALKSDIATHECEECGHKFIGGSNLKCPLCGQPAKGITND